MLVYLFLKYRVSDFLIIIFKNQKPSDSEFLNEMGNSVGRKQCHLLMFLKHLSHFPMGSKKTAGEIRISKWEKKIK